MRSSGALPRRMAPMVGVSSLLVVFAWVTAADVTVVDPAAEDEIYLPADVDLPCEFERMEWNQMTNEQLAIHFSEQAQPTILTGLTDGWPAHEKWTIEQLTQEYGDIPVSSSEMTNGFRAMWDFSEQLYVRDVLNSSLLFFTNKEMGEGLWEDMGPIPTYLQRHAGLLGMSLGRRGAYAIHHEHKPSWFAQIKGRKLWVVTAPHVGYKWSQSYPDVCHMPEEAFVGLDVKRCILKPGEVLYLPLNWGHSTCNLDHAISAGVIGTFHNSITYQVQMQDTKGIRQIMQMEEWKDISVQGDAIVFAAMFGHTSVAGFLLRNGVPVDGDPAGIAPVLEAASRGHAKMVSYLTSLGADPWPEDMVQGFDVACLNGHMEVVEALYEQCPECVHEDLGKKGFETPLHHAASEGHIPVIDFLFSHDNSTPPVNRSKQLIYLAAESGHVAAVDRMLARGADPADAQAKDGSREHALHAAAINGHFRVVDRLILRGVPVDTGNQHNDQAIHHAAIIGVPAMVSHLIHSGADPKAQSGRGETPLTLAQSRGHQAVIDVLADVGSHDEL